MRSLPIPAREIGFRTGRICQQNPAKLNCASAGIGTVRISLAISQQSRRNENRPRALPRRELRHDSHGRQYHAEFFGVSTSAKPQIESGTLRGLAVSTAQRSLLLPTLPTMIESGYPTFNMPGWGGLFAPAGTPKDIVEKLNQEVLRAVQQPELKKRLIAAGMEPPPPIDPAEFRKFVENDIARWTQFVVAVGVEKLKGDAPQQ